MIFYLVISTRDTAYLLTPWKTRNQIERAFGRLKSGWTLLAIYVDFKIEIVFQFIVALFCTISASQKAILILTKKTEKSKSLGTWKSKTISVSQILIIPIILWRATHSEHAYSLYTTKLARWLLINTAYVVLPLERSHTHNHWLQNHNLKIKSKKY